MAEKTELIRISTPTKELLNQLKIIEKESFNSVISRILQTKFEDCLALNKETKAILEQRMKNLAEGKVFSSKDLISKVEKKRKMG